MLLPASKLGAVKLLLAQHCFRLPVPLFSQNLAGFLSALIQSFALGVEKRFLRGGEAGRIAALAFGGVVGAPLSAEFFSHFAERFVAHSAVRVPAASIEVDALLLLIRLESFPFTPVHRLLIVPLEIVRHLSKALGLVALERALGRLNQTRLAT
ncbi:hypothetical protein FBZ94_103662 [Bradyrhizobium sacchari]|uniref:Uncharacterized protein n=1 Tax=Bradyrhizobium sacchari TaxID=1399419 RepID=A0A560IV88_9BRAD|nr:hypothetical protein FBZ94_103662 [Bradyrhizobium sacchari]TWB76108.1 hypothetical protein FBZ95_104288 [Bradyrhizobium sacchari]